MNIAITGASGFIGSYIAQYLHQQGHNIIATARNVKKLPEEQYFGKAEVDVLKSHSIHVLDLYEIDAIVHTATANDILSRDVEQGLILSTIGTKNVLDYCIESSIKKVVFFSTFQVYGTELNGAIDENTPTQCQNGYGLNHLFGEHYMEMYSRDKKINGIVVRPSNVYGRFITPYIQRWTLVPGCFCKEVFHKETITLLSSGKQTRNFVGLHEVSAGIAAILDHDEKSFAVYNIASEKNLSMLHVAETVKGIFEKRYGRRASIEVKSDHPQIGNAFTVNLEKLYSIGYQPDRNYNLETEINQLFDHLEKFIDEPNRTI
jgi:UDP-glucose 4-epimerase